jgi:hypothetical protein
VHKLILFYYLVNWFFIILNSFFIFKVIAILRQSIRNKNNLGLLQTFHKLKWFPIVQIICLIPGTITRIFNILHLQPYFPLVIVQTFFGSFIGVFYLIVYIRLPHVKIALKAFFQRVSNKNNSPDKDKPSGEDSSNNKLEREISSDEFFIKT